MLKTYKLKIYPEQECFVCSKPGASFDKESMAFILTLTICRHHTEVFERTLAKEDRQPSEDDE